MAGEVRIRKKVWVRILEGEGECLKKQVGRLLADRRGSYCTDRCKVLARVFEESISDISDMCMSLFRLQIYFMAGIAGQNNAMHIDAPILNLNIRNTEGAVIQIFP